MTCRLRLLAGFVAGVLLSGALAVGQSSATALGPPSLQVERKQVQAQRQQVERLQRALRRQQSERKQAAAVLDQRDRQIEALQGALRSFKPAANAP
ncbi:MAG: hypothetical protein ABW154_01380 [Dyella sp.]